MLLYRLLTSLLRAMLNKKDESKKMIGLINEHVDIRNKLNSKFMIDNGYIITGKW